MTTIITRLYPDTAAAKAVVGALTARGHKAANIEIVTAGGDLAGVLAAARVGKSQAAAYAPHIAGGAALLVYRAPFNPIGIARDAIRTVDAHPAMDVGVADENEYVREQPYSVTDGSILHGHPLLMTRPGSIGAGGRVAGGSASTPTRTSAMRGGGFMSTRFLPFPLLRHKESHSAFAGGRLMAGGKVLRNWRLSDMLGIGLLLRS